MGGGGVCSLSCGSAVPVSYTHLDVYKRQINLSPNISSHLSSLVKLSISVTKKVYKSSDTEKYVYELKDNRYIETVFIKRRDGCLLYTSAYQEDIEEIKGVLAEIWRLQRLSLLKAL